MRLPLPPKSLRWIALPAAGLALISVGLLAREAPDRWWKPGEGRVFPAALDYVNADGTLRLILDKGPMPTKGHPFFEPLGRNGRACVTCHQPADSMSLSAESARTQWERTKGRDPLFAAIDGANCPDLPQASRASHSLLIEHGLFRIARAWPPRDAQGKAIKPDFSIEVVRDPSGCNISPKWGIAARGEVSVFRRPRPVANMKYILAMGFPFDPKPGLALPLDPETGKPVSGNLMADRRALSLTAQMREASSVHLEFAKALTKPQIAQILDFEGRIYSSQQRDRVGGALDAAGAEGGTAKLAYSPPGRLGSQGVPIWSEFAAWEKPGALDGLPPAERAFRESVARGARSFRERTFLISDSMGINWPVGFGNPVRNACAFCHNMSQMGMDVAPGQVDLGTTTMPFADNLPHLPLFKLSCTGKPHPRYGRTIYTHDPGYALTTGKCVDVGRITLQTMRGLSARAPYFSNGSAKDLRGVIDYYDRRYNIGYTEQEKQDLVNLMKAL